MMYPISAAHDTARRTTSPPIRLRPGERIAYRTECWRPDCRDRQRGYSTVAYLTNGMVIAWCHRSRYHNLALAR